MKAANSQYLAWLSPPRLSFLVYFLPLFSFSFLLCHSSLHLFPLATSLIFIHCHLICQVFCNNQLIPITSSPY